MPEPLPREAKSESLHFPQYLPSSRGGPEAFMEAMLGGELQVRGRCLGLYLAESGDFRTIVWSAKARIGTDERGIYVSEGGARFRPGDQVMGGGGTMPDDFSDNQLAAPFPDECRGKGAVQLYGLRLRERNPDPPQSPPPPPQRN